MNPKRSPGKSAISVSLETELLERIDVRRKALGLTRSAYLCNLAENDLVKGGNFVIAQKPNKAQPPAKTIPDSNYPSGISEPFRLNDRDAPKRKRKS